MKYIRTKDGIREYNELASTIRYWHTNVVCSDDIEKSVEEDIKNLNIIAQANTIEELCDEFVIQFGDGTWETYKWFGAIQDCLKMDYYKGCKYYGAIWTDKGLIYIAKLTKKGWELV